MARDPLSTGPVAAPTPADAAAMPRWLPRLFEPLRIRDFRLMWLGLAVSLMGDGIYFVALAWLVYDLSNSPTALSVVSVAWSVPVVAFVLVGGIASDRFDRRVVLVVGDVVRAVAVGMMGLLAVTGRAELWHIIVLAALYGMGEALFGPAFGAIVPDVVPRELLLQANSLDNFARPFGERLIGPALGGLIVASFGAGVGLLLDGASFAFSALAIAAMRPQRASEGAHPDSVLRDLKQGFAFVRSQTWLWGTLASAGITLLFVLGPWEVLLPFLARNELGSGADGLGLIYAAGGVGAVLAALLMGQARLPRRHITFMYVAWAVGMLTVAGFAFITETWHGMILEGIGWAAFSAGLIVWGTLMHTHIPSHLLGRVTSVDWMVSISLTPISFALTGPLSQAFGVDAVFIVAGVAGSLTTLGFLALPRMRDLERA